MKNNKLIRSKNKWQINKTKYEEVNSEILTLTQQVRSIIVTSNKDYHSKKKCQKKLNKKLVQKNIFGAKYTKSYFEYKLQSLLAQQNINKVNDVVLYNFVNFLDTHDKTNDTPYGCLNLWRTNRCIRKINTKVLRLSYLNDIFLKRKLNIARRVWLKGKIKHIEGRLQMYQSLINDIKQNFFSNYYASQVMKLDKIKKNKGIKKIHSDYVIELKNVCKYYDNGSLATKVLQDVNLKIKYGEFVVILGPSGSGKTTLLNIISGMDTATYGKTIVCNSNLINYSVPELTEFRRKNIGYVFQQYGLLPNLTIKENVEIGANLQSKKSARINIDELLKTIGIYEHRNKFPSELSGGQQQRVSIARSIAKNPKIIFGDEPTGAVDEKMSQQIMQLFVDINKKYKTTIIIVTHNPIFADLADTVIKVSNGTVSSVIKNKYPKAVKDLKWGK